MRKVLLGKYLLPGEGEVYSNCGVVVNQGNIEAIGLNKKLKKNYKNNSEYKLVDYTDKIIAPGFVNSHMHSYGVLSHGIPAPDVNNFESFLNDFWWPLVEDKIDHQMIEVTTKAMALKLLESGVTSFCNIMESPNAIPNALKIQAKVLEDIGVRAVLSFEACERMNKKNGQLGLQENKNFYLSYKNNPLISGMMCIHTTFTCSPDFIKQAGEIAREIGSGIQMHVSESSYEVDYCQKKYGKLPIELYKKYNFLSNHVLGSQGVKLTKKEIKIISEKDNVNIAHVPLSNCEVGGGIAPIPELLEKGINVGLGTDGYINNFFETMRAAFLLHKASHENPAIMSAKEVFKIATENGGKALGIKGLGILKKGNPADLITIDTDFMTPLTKKNIFEQVILYCNPKDVKEVYVNGNLLKKDGKLLNIEMRDIKEKVNKEAERLWKEIRK